MPKVIQENQNIMEDRESVNVISVVAVINRSNEGIQNHDIARPPSDMFHLDGS